MLKKNAKGITLVALLITIVVLAILTTITLNFGGHLFNTVKLKTLDTNILLIQAKVKVLSEKSQFDDSTSLIGIKVSELGSSNEKVNALKSKGVIQEGEESYKDYYLWTQEDLNTEGLDAIQLKSTEAFIVNYETEEIIYYPGYIHTDKNTYYKLSDITKLQEEK